MASRPQFAPAKTLPLYSHRRIALVGIFNVLELFVLSGRLASSLLRRSCHAVNAKVPQHDIVDGELVL